MKRNSLEKEILGLLGIIVIMALFSSIGSAAVGDHIGSVTFSVNCTSGTGVGIAYDGSNLWYSCFQSGVNLFRADSTGTVTASFNVSGSGLGALAYNASGNSIWAGVSGGDIYLIQLNATKDVVSSTLVFNTNPHLNWGILDGLAYDGKDNTLYLSPDGSKIIHHYAVDGTHLNDGPNANGDFLWAGNASYNISYYNSGLALGGDLLYEGSNGGSHVWVVNKTNPLVELFNFSTIVAGDPNFRDEDLECDTNTFAPIDVMWSKEAFNPMRAHAFEIPKGTCGIGGKPAAPKGNISGMKFNDLNGNGIHDAGEPGLANWTITLTNQSGNVITTITDASGNYSFTNLTDGNYTVGEVLQSGWIQTAPTTGTFTITISGGNLIQGLDFGNERIPPKAFCLETVNPAGKNVPPAGSTTLPGSKGGQNEDGFYELQAKGFWSPFQIFVRDTGSGTIFPLSPPGFSPGTKIKYTQAPGATPSIKMIGGPNSAVDWHITGTSDAAVYTVDMFGDKGPEVLCKVPPPPK